MPAVDRSYLLRGTYIHNSIPIFHLILGLNYAYIFPGVGLLELLGIDVGDVPANEKTFKMKN